VNLVNAINQLRARARCWPTTTAATAACGRGLRNGLCRPRGRGLNVDMLVTEGDGISDSRADTATPRTGPAGRRAARRADAAALFSEELGVVLQVRTAERNEVMQTLREHGLSRLQPFHRQDPSHVIHDGRGQG
jgi:phosphoribosylformylglycinamidine synthase